MAGLFCFLSAFQCIFIHVTLYALYVTGFSFHLVSIFDDTGLSRENHGKITGFVMSLIVFASALGPILMSSVFSFTGSYKNCFRGIALFVALVAVFSFKADNPQEKITNLR